MRGEGGRVVINNLTKRGQKGILGFRCEQGRVVINILTKRQGAYIPYGICLFFFSSGNAFLMYGFLQQVVLKWDYS